MTRSYDEYRESLVNERRELEEQERIEYEKQLYLEEEIHYYLEQMRLMKGPLQNIEDLFHQGEEETPNITE